MFTPKKPRMKPYQWLASALLPSLCFLCSVQAQSSEPGEAAIKTMLLAARDWIVEIRLDRDGELDATGLVRFETAGEQLIGKLFTQYNSRWQLQCAFEVALVPDGFNYPGCLDHPQLMKLDPKNPRVPFKEKDAGYSMTFRPMR